MNILTIDSATSKLHLSLQANRQRFFIDEEVGTTHSDVIVNYITNLLNQANLTINDIELIAYNAGPGSFTGLRIGVAVTLGIAYGLGIKVLAVDSFFILGYQFKQQLLLTKLTRSKLIIALDARLQQVYYAQLDLNSLTYLIKPMLMSPEQLQYSSDSYFAGDGFTVYSELINQELNNKCVNLDAYPYALLDYALEHSCQGLNPMVAKINYVRNNVALKQFEQRSKPIC